MWVVAEGYKKQRNVRYMCWPSMIINWTTVPLIITALRILREEVSQHGVLPSEACFDLVSFFDEASMYIPEEHRGNPLFNERFDWLNNRRGVEYMILVKP